MRTAHFPCPRPRHPAAPIRHGEPTLVALECCPYMEASSGILGEAERLCSKPCKTARTRGPGRQRGDPSPPPPQGPGGQLGIRAAAAAARSSLAWPLDAHAEDAATRSSHGAGEARSGAARADGRWGGGGGTRPARPLCGFPVSLPAAPARPRPQATPPRPHPDVPARLRGGERNELCSTARREAKNAHATASEHTRAPPPPVFIIATQPNLLWPGQARGRPIPTASSGHFDQQLDTDSG